MAISSLCQSGIFIRQKLSGKVMRNSPVVMQELEGWEAVVNEHEDVVRYKASQGLEDDFAVLRSCIRTDPAI